MVDTPNGARPHLKYTNGEPCDNDPRSQYTTLIEFYCDPKAGKVSVNSAFQITAQKIKAHKLAG